MAAETSQFDWEKWGAKPAKEAAPAMDFDYKQWGARPAGKSQQEAVEQPEEKGFSFWNPEQNDPNQLPLHGEGINTLKDFDFPQYLKGLGQSTLNSAANQSAAINNLAGTNMPYFHDLPKASGKSEQLGQNIGEYALDIVPGSAGFKAAGMIAKAPQEASLLSKLLRATGRTAIGAGTGATVGAATNENRSQGTQSGALAGALSVAIPGAVEGLSNRLGNRAATKAEEALKTALQQESTAKQQLAVTKAKAKELKLPSDVEQYPYRRETNEQAIKAMEQERANLPNEDFPESVLHPAHTQLTPRAEHQIANINHKIAQYLEHGEPNDERLAQMIAQRFEGRLVDTPNGPRRTGGLKQELGKEFQDLDKSFAGKEIKIPNAINEEEITDLAKKHLGDHSNPIAYKSFIDQSHDYFKDMAGHTIQDAQSLYRKYRTLTMEATRVRRGLTDRGITPEEYARRVGIAGAHDAEAEQIEKILKNQIGGDPFERLTKVKHRWKTEYAPVTELKNYQNIVEHERINDRNLPSTLRGAHPGNAILRNYIQSNPEASRLNAAMQFSENPEQLANLNRTNQDYINQQSTPLLHELQQQQQNAMQAIPQAQAQQQHFTEMHQRIAQVAKEHAAQREQAQKIEAQLPKIKEENANLTRLEKQIRLELEKKNLTKEQREAKQEHYDYIIKQKAANTQTIKSISKVLAGLLAVSSFNKNH